MTASATPAASQRQACRKREDILRQRSSKNEGRESPQSVSSTDLSCCALHEWPVFPPRGDADDFAITAFTVLRARSEKTELTDWAPSRLAAVQKELSIYGCLNVGSRR
jgi:hypothetical protein